MTRGDTFRRTAALLVLSALVVGSVSAGVAAQTFRAREGCSVPGQVTRHGRWEHIRIPSFAAGPQSMTEFGVDPADPRRLYATNGVSVAVSGDGGCSWRTTFRLDAPPAGADYSAADAVITDLAVAPGHALLAISQRDGLRPHVVLSSYAGETWRRGDDGLRTALGHPVGVALTRANPGYAYLLVQEGAGAGGPRASLGDKVYESTTAGGAWSVRDPGLPDAGLDLFGEGVIGPGRGLGGLVADPVEAGRLFLYGPGGLYAHQQGARTPLLVDPVRAAAVFRAPAAPAPTVVASFEGSREVDVSRDGGESFTTFRAPAEVDSFAEALRTGDFYFSSGGRVYLRSRGRSIALPGGGIIALASAHSQRQMSPFTAQSVLTLYGRTTTSIVRTTERRTIDLLPVPDSVVVGNLGSFGSPTTALAGSLIPGHAEIVLREGQTRKVPYELYLPETPTPLDVFFDVDTTNSMIPAIDGLRAAIANIIRELTEAKIDVWFGVGQYKSFNAPPAFERMQDIAPPGEELAEALNRLVASDGGLETQLESLRQIATGEGSGSGVGIAPGQDAHWRRGSLRIVVNMTDEPISTGDPHPTYEEVADVMLADDIVHFGIAVQNETTAEALGPPLPGLIEIARVTRSFAPPQGVDCDGDDDPDLYDGEPLVCVIDHVNSRNASVLGGAIISVLSSLTDIGEVGISATVAGAPERGEEVVAVSKPVVGGVDFKANNKISFDLELTCPTLDETRRFPIEIEAAREAGALASADALLTCRAKPEPEPPAPLPPLVPPVVAALILPQPPPPPPVHPVANPNPPNPKPNPNPNPQPQSQGQPQGAMATQRQTQPQLAVVQEREAAFRPQEARRGPTEEYALSAYAPPETGPNGALLGFAAALVISFGTALLALQRAELRLARARSRGLPRDRTTRFR
ncbi:MAG: VWA domain-containing protein [Actinomycetota bacterium]|nr:VWA domain-containing protein [Actinomycetota bacterium]